MRKNNRSKLNSYQQSNYIDKTSTLKPEKKEHQSKTFLSRTLDARNHSEYEHLVNIKRSVLENPKIVSEKTISDDWSSAFGPNMRGLKIKNLRA